MHSKGDFVKYKDHLKAIEELNKEVHDLAWNLAGCSTYALGHSLDKGHCNKLSRPALDDVLKLTLDHKELKAENKKLNVQLAAANGQAEGYKQALVDRLPQPPASEDL